MKSLTYLMLLALPALNAQQSPDSTASRGVNFYSIEQESALGAQMASEFQRQSQMLDNAQVNGYLTSVGDRLLKQIPETGFTFHFAAFVDKDTSGLHEARVLPGGYIYVPESLILSARDEAEFAGMLAHAVAHAASRHAARQASRGNAAALATIPLVAGGGWAEYDAQRNAREAISAISTSLIRSQREFELEADYRAVPMMAGAGWDPGALARYIEREQSVPDPRKPGTAPRVFAPLPPRDDRVAAIRQTAGNLPPRDYSTSPEFAAVQAEVRRLNAERPPSSAAPTEGSPQK
jgi:predicted Zn-dependent protease